MWGKEKKVNMSAFVMMNLLPTLMELPVLQKTWKQTRVVAME